jgi:predicted nucleic acid-binding protein
VIPGLFECGRKGFRQAHAERSRRKLAFPVQPLQEGGPAISPFVWRGARKRGIAEKPLGKERGKNCRKAGEYSLPPRRPQGSATRRAPGLDRGGYIGSVMDRRIVGREATAPAFHPPLQACAGSASGASTGAPAQGAAASAASADRPMLAVLDTNVVLDWLWFDDPRLVPLTFRLRAGTLRWLATPPMREELAAVLGRATLPARPRSAEGVLADYDRWCALHPEPVAPAHSAALRCTDTDDQKFIDLALTLARNGGATALLTRDRAVLRLARHARLHRLWIGPPERWCDPAGPIPG